MTTEKNTKYKRRSRRRREEEIQNNLKRKKERKKWFSSFTKVLTRVVDLSCPFYQPVREFCHLALDHFPFHMSISPFRVLLSKAPDTREGRPYFVKLQTDSLLRHKGVLTNWCSVNSLLAYSLLWDSLLGSFPNSSSCLELISNGNRIFPSIEGWFAASFLRLFSGRIDL